MLSKYRYFLILFILFFILSGAYPDISKYLNSITFSGSILVTKNENTIYQYDENKHAYQIGSITKVFTAICILKLQEEGLLSIDDNIDKYISVPYANPITIKQLLSNTSGIPDYGKDNENKRQIVEYASMRHTINDIKQLFINKPLMFDPGSFYSYSSSNYILLGEIIEKTSGMKYEEYVQKTILNPAGMVHTGVFENKEKMENISEKNNNDNLLKSKYIDLTYYSSAGGIVSTVEDMNAFGKALVSEKIILRSSIEMMNTEQRNGYGLGWGVIRSGKMIHGAHSGKTYGYSSYFSINEYNGVIITVLSNNDDMDSKALGIRLLNMLGIDE